MSVTVYGASDDLIEVEGDVEAEFTFFHADRGSLLTLSCGVVLNIDYTDDGVWRIRPEVGGGVVDIEFAEGPDSDKYSDRATVHPDVGWVVYGHIIRRARP